MITGLSRHRQIDPYRAGRGAAELGLACGSISTVSLGVDLIGKDAISSRTACRVTSFRDGNPALGAAKQRRALFSMNMTLAAPT